MPILAMEGIGATNAVKRSAGLVKGRWGEAVTGNLAIGAWSVVVVIPACLMLGVGGALVQEEPAAGLALVATGLVTVVAISAIVAATRQVFAVTLYRYAIDAPIGGFAPADLENPFTGAKGGEKRKSWILRIGVPILGLFFVLVILAAIFGPDRRTAAEGYFHVTLPKSSLTTLGPGSPVTAGSPDPARARIGSVETLSDRGSGVFVELRIDPRYNRLVESILGQATGPRNRQVLCFGSPQACRAPPPRPAG